MLRIFATCLLVMSTVVAEFDIDDCNLLGVHDMTEANRNTLLGWVQALKRKLEQETDYDELMELVNKIRGESEGEGDGVEKPVEVYCQLNWNEFIRKHPKLVEVDPVPGFDGALAKADEELVRIESVLAFVASEDTELGYTMLGDVTNAGTRLTNVLNELFANLPWRAPKTDEEQRERGQAFQRDQALAKQKAGDYGVLALGEWFAAKLRERVEAESEDFKRISQGLLPGGIDQAAWKHHELHDKSRDLHEKGANDQEPLDDTSSLIYAALIKPLLSQFAKFDALKSMMARRAELVSRYKASVLALKNMIPAAANEDWSYRFNENFVAAKKNAEEIVAAIKDFNQRYGDIKIVIPEKADGEGYTESQNLEQMIVFLDMAAKTGAVPGGDRGMAAPEKPK